MMYSTATIAPAMAPQIANFLASSAACCASAYRPDVQRPETWVDLMIETIPSGRQHSTVTRIAHTRLLSGGAPPAPGPPGGGKPPVGGGGGKFPGGGGGYSVMDAFQRSS